MSGAVLYLAYSVVLLFTICAGLVRIIRGPTAADRMMAVQLFGTTGVAILLLQGRALSAPSLHDVALVFALLAAVTTVAFVRRYWAPTDEEEERDESF